MSKELLRAKEYCFFTFASTQHALKAEKALLKQGEDCIIIPTPREISASCGLAIKVHCDRCRSIDNFLKHEKVLIDGIYQIDKNGIRAYQ